MDFETLFQSVWCTSCKKLKSLPGLIGLLIHNEHALYSVRQSCWSRCCVSVTNRVRCVVRHRTWRLCSGRWRSCRRPTTNWTRARRSCRRSWRTPTLTWRRSAPRSWSWRRSSATSTKSWQRRRSVLSLLGIKYLAYDTKVSPWYLRKLAVSPDTIVHTTLISPKPEENEIQGNICFPVIFQEYNIHTKYYIVLNKFFNYTGS